MIFNILRNILPRHLAFGIFFLNLTSKSSSRHASFPPKQPSRLPSLCPRPLLCGLMFSVCSYPSFACPLPSFFTSRSFGVDLHLLHSPITTGEMGPHTISVCPFNFPHSSKYLKHPIDPIISYCASSFFHAFALSKAITMWNASFHHLPFPFLECSPFKFLFRLPRARRPLFSISHAQFIPIMRRIQPLTNARTLSQPKAPTT